MKKILAAFLALMTAATLFAGCGQTGKEANENTDNTPNETVEPVEPAVVEIWHTYTGDQAAYLDKAAKQFNASQSDYQVKVLAQAYSGFADAVYNAVANHTGPSIIFNYASTAVDYIEADLAVDITAYIEEDKKNGDDTMSKIIDSLPEAMKTDVMGFADGGIYYLPGCTTGPVFFYNKTMYDELDLVPPATWEELAENCRVIYEAKGIPGYVADGLTDDIQALLMQNGIGYIDVANKTVEFGGTETEAIYRWFVDNCNAGYFELKPTQDYASNDFVAAVVAGFSGSCVNDQYITEAPFEIGIAPCIASGKEDFYTAWNRGPIFLAQNERTDRGAYEFIKFFLSPEMNGGWAQVNSALSPYGTTAEDAAYQAYLADVPESLAAVEANLDKAGSFPNIHGCAQLRNLLTEYLEYAVSGAKTVSEAVAELVDACNEALAD